MSENLQFANNMSTRVYKYVGDAKYNPLGRQPAMILSVIKTLKSSFTVKQVSDACDANGYYAAAGTMASVAWHLNQMLKRNVVELSK